MSNTVDILRGIYDQVALQQAMSFNVLLTKGHAHEVIGMLLRYTDPEYSPLEAIWEPPEDSSAWKLLQTIKSALGMILIHHAWLSRNPEIKITNEEAERLLQDPIFQRLRQQVEVLSKTSNLFPGDIDQVTN
jgi:hypothetical protein